MGITIREAIEQNKLELNRNVAIALKILETKYGSDYEFSDITEIRALITKVLNP